MFKVGHFFGPITETASGGKETAEDSNRPIIKPHADMDRRRMLQGTGMLAGAFAMLAAPAHAADGEDGPGSIVGLYSAVISSPNNAFPSFPIFGLWGPGIFIGSGQPDMTSPGLSSAAWGSWKQTGQRAYRVVARFWTYNPDTSPSGWAGFVTEYALAANGNSYHGQGPLQYYDVGGHPLGPPYLFYDDGVRIA